MVSREPGRFHHSAGSFGQARTTDGRFLRYVWSCYSLDPTDREPLADQELEFWYVVRGQPGYDSWHSCPLKERMELGGKRLRARTDADGKAFITLPHLDAVGDVHYFYQLVVRCNSDRSRPDFKPVQNPQLEFYACSYQDPSLP